MYRKGSAIAFAFDCVNGIKVGEKREVDMDALRYQCVSLATMRGSLYSISLSNMFTLKTKVSNDRSKLIIERIE